MDDRRNDSLFRAAASRQDGSRAPEYADVYQPTMPRWTRHGLPLLGALALLLLAAATFLTVTDYVRIRAIIQAHGEDLVVVVSAPLPGRAAFEPGAHLRFLADGEHQVPRRLRLDHRIDEPAAMTGVAGDPATNGALVFAMAFLDAGQQSDRSAQGAVGMLIVPAGELALWEHLRRWL